MNDGENPPNEERTVIKVGVKPDLDGIGRGVDGPGGTVPPVATTPTPPEPPRAAAGLVVIGTVLNHIYRVDRFIAAGGMGAVYEGINIASDERVAIKVMLPHLAADPQIQTLFRNEARTMTQLSHPALVQYRLLAQEPSLGVFYIVTEYIDGPPLSDLLGDRSVTGGELRQLGIRLASGLAVAHDLGKIHRDMSPDNVLLPSGNLDQAKVIDFGIAKDLSAENKTVIGTGFAGKYAFVAPEQLDDTRDVGPWTDVYGLGLVLLAVALGKNPPMGASPISAVEARKTIPDLSAVPEELRPCLSRMLEPDRRKRFQSMHEVVDALKADFVAPAPRSVSLFAVLLAKLDHLFGGAVPKPVLLGSGIAIGLALVFVLALVLWPHATPIVPLRAPAVATGTAGPPREELVRKAVEGALPAISCSWIDIDYPENTGSGTRVLPRGVAGEPGWSQTGLEQLGEAARSGDTRAEVVVDGVLPVQPQACRILDALRMFREPSSQIGRALVVKQPQFHLQANAENCDAGVTKQGLSQAEIVMDIRIDDPAADFTLIGVDGNGAMQQILADRAQFDQIRAKSRMISTIGNGVYRWSFCTDEKTALSSPHGLAGILLIKGRHPFALGLPLSQSDTQPVSSEWVDRFIARARAEGWTTQMAWYQVLKN